MKKKTALLIALLLVLQTFASCADTQQDETTGETAPKAASETIAEETESETRITMVMSTRLLTLTSAEKPSPYTTP